MLRRRCLLLAIGLLAVFSLAVLADAQPTRAASAPARRRKHGKAGEPKFCVVVRTYWGHANPEGGLRRVLRSLQRQNIQK